MKSVGLAYKKKPYESIQSKSMENVTPERATFDMDFFFLFSRK